MSIGILVLAALALVCIVHRGHECVAALMPSPGETAGCRTIAAA